MPTPIPLFTLIATLAYPRLGKGKGKVKMQRN